MNYLQYGCMLFIISRYPKMDVIEILRDRGITFGKQQFYENT